MRSCFFLCAALLALSTGGVSGEEVTLTLPGSVPLVVVRVPAGTFMMGSPTTERGRDTDEGPPHNVEISQAYFIGKYEVTQRQWVAVMGSNPSRFVGCGLDCPVEQVSWDDVCGGLTGLACSPGSFIGRLNQHLGTTGFRLPTEAQWERAARGGAAAAMPFSFAAPDNWDTGCGAFAAAEAFMFWCNNSADRTHPVGQRQENPYNLHDMHGNVWEWVADWYASYPSGTVVDPSGPPAGTMRVFRGGSWGQGAMNCRSARRHASAATRRDGDLGFRIAGSVEDACPPPGSAPALTATPTSSSSVTLSWNVVPGAASYTLSRDGNPVFQGEALTFTDTGLAAGTRVCYTARASSTCGDGPVSQPQCVTTHPGLPRPQARHRLQKQLLSVPRVITTEVYGITDFGAFGGGTVTADGGAAVTSRGLCWRAGGEPTIADSSTEAGDGTGSFTSYIPDLLSGTAYAVRAWATNAVGTGYGEAVTLSTLTPDPRLEYLGQAPPGRRFVRFAPGIVPEDMYHSVTVSPDGQEIYWAALTGGGRARLMVTRIVGGGWTAPTPVVLGGRPSGEFWDDGPVVSPDNRKLFFTSFRPFGSSTQARWWYMCAERTATGWGAPAPLPEVISATYGGHWGPSVTRSGTLYFGHYLGGSEHVFYSRLVGGQYTASELLSLFAPGAPHDDWYVVCPFVAPDESYLIFNKVEAGVSVGYFVSFRGSGGTWLPPVRLDSFPSPSFESTFVTRDGKYVFCKSYWASGELIEEHRPGA